MEAAAIGTSSKRGERRRQRAAELGLYGRPHDVEGFGRHLVAAFLHLVDQLRREDPLTGTDDLAELDVGRAELLGRDPDAPRDPGPGP